MQIEEFLALWERSFTQQSRRKLWDLLLAAIMGGVMGEITGIYWMFFFATSGVALIIVVHDLIAEIARASAPKIITPQGYSSPSRHNWHRGLIVLFTLSMLGICIFSAVKARQAATSQAVPAQSEPIYCFIGTNGVTEDHGVAQFINSITVKHDGRGDPTDLVVMFTKFLVNTPKITSFDSNIYEVTSTRDDMAHLFTFTFQNVHSLPRKGPFLIRMEITN